MRVPLTKISALQDFMTNCNEIQSSISLIHTDLVLRTTHVPEKVCLNQIGINDKTDNVCIT